MRISKHFQEVPLAVPAHPFWTAFKNFGRDEAIALIINVIATGIISLFSTNTLFLALAGPVIEKIGFFPAHFRDAWIIYKTTSKRKRKPLKSYVAHATKKGAKSLLQDVLLHDPIYIVLMMLGLFFYPTAPAWILAVTCFIIAVFAVSLIEVGYTELQYMNFKKKLSRIGFKWERYFESRFFISESIDPERLMDELTEAFGIQRVKTISYYDTYMENTLPHFSNRTPKTRLRRRNSSFNDDEIQSVQVVYSIAREGSLEQSDQHRYFVTRKEKAYLPITGKMPKVLKELTAGTVKSFMKKITREQYKKVSFKRLVARDEELLVSVDKVHEHRNFFLVEIKVHRDTTRLMKAMRHVMIEYPVIQTTRQKIDLDESTK